MDAILEPRAVGDVTGAFFVPGYQRRYRWGPDEVDRLLADIWESNGEPYYLQPVVVEQMADGRWELIDGQQRFTTLYLIFEDTGIDYVIVDEKHMYKNLATESNIRDAAIEGSDRASDLHMKLEYLRSAGRERVVTAATATPISNSITETYVMQRHLRPDVLESGSRGSRTGRNCCGCGRCSPT